MSAAVEFDELVRRLRGGDQDAARRVFEHFTQRLVGVAASHLGSKLQQKVDPEDVVQSVYRSFFRRVQAGEFQLDDWGSLWGLLLQSTLWKCGHRVDYYLAACRDVQRDAGQAADESSAALFEPVARDPSPEEQAMLAELVDALLAGLSDEQDRRIVQLRLQGYDIAEIAPLVQLSERTVHRTLALVKSQLQRQLNKDLPD